MSTYRPSYNDHPRSYYDLPPPPPSNLLPPLPYSPPPPYDSHYHRNGDSWRPSDVASRRNEFTFRIDDAAPQYPRERDYLRPTRSMQYTMQENNRPKPRNQHRDTMNLNHPRRGQYFQSGRYNRNVPSERPLLKHQDDGNDSNEELLGMAAGQAGASKFMPAEDVSDSDEEQMDESESDVVQSDGDDVELANEQTTRDKIEPPAKRRALGSSSRNVQDGASEPKWSNPDPYTVLPPVDDSQRKRKDVVKLIRKARKEAEVTATERNQVAANDDFISFGMDDENPEMLEETPFSPRADGREQNGVGMPGVLPGPRQFSHLTNLHNEDVPGVSGPYVSAHDLGPPPDLLQHPPKFQDKSVIHTDLSVNGNATKNETILVDRTNDAALGSRKRTHNDLIKEKMARPDKPALKRQKGNQVKGSIVDEWIALGNVDPTPWLRREDKLTENAGFRLHKEICDFYDFVKPQRFEQAIREELLTRLQNVISDHLPNCRVYSFGSFAAGLYLPTADMDVVIISDSFRSTGQKVVCQSNKQMQKLGKFLEISNLAQPGSVQVIIHAKIPIIKFVDLITAIKVDVSFENNTGVIANNTFAVWKRRFPAMPVLVTVIKQFLMMRNLNEVQFGGLGGFSVTCLVTNLLQNMPRVQTGQLIPEEHLGEILIEFLDLYGNRLDTTRTGLMMNPPGYFDKQAYNRHVLGKPVYQVNKADRLAIMDPNNPENDISGGSKEVMCIFDRFSQAHTAILTAMKESNCPSLLEGLIGGDYESFGWQRKHLLDLYKERWGATADIPDQDRLLEWTEPKLRGGYEPLVELQSAASAHMQNVQALTKSNTKPIEARISVTKALSKAQDQQLQELQACKSRANALRRQYPDMNGIPEAIDKAQKRQLVQKYEQRDKAKKGKNRKAAQVKASLPASAGTVANQMSDSNRTPMFTAMRAPLPPAKAQRKRAPRGKGSRKMHNGTSHNFNVINQLSNKMAPLSDERRAEVGRNLKGLTPNDPINID